MLSTVSPETTADLPAESTPDDTLAVTIDDDDNVLELIYSNADGIYVRDNGEWTLANSEEEQPTIDDQFWVDVTPEFIAVYDQLMQSQDGIVREDAAPYDAAPA